MKGRAIKVLEENMGEYLHDYGVGKYFLNKIFKRHIHKGKYYNIYTLKLCTSIHQIKNYMNEKASWEYISNIHKLTNSSCT